jgi:hypothetical protein
MAKGNPNPSPATRFSSERQPQNRRRPDPLLAAINAKLTPQRAEIIADRVLAKAEAGDLMAIGMLWDRTAGKAVARNEQGDPGSFDLDLSGWSDADVKKAVKKLRRVK